MAVLYATDENFDELIQNGVTLIDFYTTHCGPCRVLLTDLLEIEGTFPVFNLIKVNLDHCPELCKRFLIEFTPTLYLGKDGKLTEYNASTEKEEICKAIAKLYYDFEVSKENENIQKEPETLETAQAAEQVKPVIRLNEDHAVVARLQAALKAGNGYCPCRTQKTPENKCMCQEFRDQIADPEYEGYCHCKLYYVSHVKVRA